MIYTITNDVIKYAIKTDAIKYAITNYVINKEINNSFVFPNTPCATHARWYVFVLLQSDKNGIFKPPGRVLDAYFFRLSKTWHFISVRVKWSYHFGRKRWPFHTGQNYALYKYASRSTSMGVVMNNISCKIILLINMPPPSNTHTHTHTHLSPFFKRCIW